MQIRSFMHAIKSRQEGESVPDSSSDTVKFYTYGMQLLWLSSTCVCGWIGLYGLFVVRGESFVIFWHPIYSNFGVSSFMKPMKTTVACRQIASYYQDSHRSTHWWDGIRWYCQVNRALQRFYFVPDIVFLAFFADLLTIFEAQFLNHSDNINNSSDLYALLRLGISSIGDALIVTNIARMCIVWYCCGSL